MGSSGSSRELLGHNEVHEISKGRDQKVPLLSLTLRDKVVMASQQVQRAVEVNTQARQCAVAEERGSQRDDLFDVIASFGVALPVVDQSPDIPLLNSPMETFSPSLSAATAISSRPAATISVTSTKTS